MNINRNLFANKGRWSPNPQRIPEPKWMAFIGGAVIGVLVVLGFCFGL